MSRPRFWPYLFGPFALGIAASPLDAVKDNVLLLLGMGLYFTFSANLLIYGINDIYDYETDKNNPKKKGYEALVKPSQHNFLASAIAISTFPFIIPFLFWPSAPIAARISLALFLFFGVGYSAPPIRAKVRPFIDMLFNSLYVFPALVAYGITVDSLPPSHVFVAAVLWCMAMHAYSAVPDIASDKKAKVNTVATVLGAKGTLLLCICSYVLAGVLVLQDLGIFAVMATAVYAGVMLLSYTSPKRQAVFKLYKLFPYINFSVGFALFWYIVAIVKV